MSLLLESNSADTDGEESQNRKHDLQSLTWQNIKIDGNKMAALVRVIKSIIESTDDLPQIIEAGKAVEKASSGIEWLQDHKKDFERIIGRASILIIVLWKSYKKSKDHSPVWPTPKLRMVIDNLVNTVHRIEKLMKRKFENFAKRTFGFYDLRDLGKFKKYEQRLDSVAEDLENLSNIIKINEVLQELLDTQAQHHDNIEPSEESTQKRADIQDFFAEGSNSQRNAIAVAKPTNRKTTSDEKNEVDQTKHKALEKIKIQQKNVYDSVVPSFEDVHISENKGTKKKSTIDEDVEGASGQGFATNRAGWMKDRKSPSQILEDKFSTDNGDLAGVTTMGPGPTKEEKPAKTPRQNATSDEKNEVDQTKYKAPEKIKNNVIYHNDFGVQSFKDVHGSENKGKKIDDDAEEWTSEQGFAINRASLMKDRKSPNQISEDKFSTDSGDVIYNNDSKVQSFKDVHSSEDKGKKKKTTINDDAEEWISEQGFAMNRAGWMKDRKSQGQISEDKFSTDNGDVIYNNDSKVQSFKDVPGSENKGKKKKTTIGDDAEEWTSRQGFAMNRAGSSWMKDRKSLSQISEDRFSTDNGDVIYNNDSAFQSFKDVHGSENKGKKKKTTIDDDAEEWTSGQSFAINRAGWLKDRKSQSQISEDKFSTDNGDVQVSVTTMGPTKEKKPAKKTSRQNWRRDTAPAQLPPVSIGGAFINNHGSGTVYNRKVGGIKDSNVSDVGNDNSENHYLQPRPGRYATTLRQNTVPAQLPRSMSIGGAFVNNYGSGNVSNSEVGNISNSTISNVGNNNSKNYHDGIQPRRRKTHIGDSY